MHKRIEITAVERERIVIVSKHFYCPVCRTISELFTVAQAAAAQVKTTSVRRWLASNKTHGIKTCGGQHRICKNSLFQN